MWRWISIALIVVLVGGGVFFGIRITAITKQLNELESSHATLQSEYASLQSDYNSLESDYSSVESSYESLSSDYYVLQGMMSQLESSYSQLQTENASLQQLLQEYDKVPHAYYSARNFPYHSNTVEGLSDFLIYDFVLPRDYRLNIFDCSESATYLEWALETSGFDARIARGKCPWNPSLGYHAWVLVYFDNNTYLAVEPTALTWASSYLTWLSGRVPGVVYTDDPAWNNYNYNYDQLFDNIYLAIKHSGSSVEWNWWEGYWGFT
ncbi:hypothetical protein ES708_24230 [subsurface metagenome]